MLRVGVLAAAWVHVVLAFGERSQAGYKEEIVFPEKLNSSFHQDWPGNGDEGSSEGHLRFRCRAFGEELTLDLERDPSFLSEDLTVQYLGRNGQSEASGLSESGSYFTGAVNSDPESIAAVNYNGASLLGVLQYRGSEYHIQPLEGGGQNSAEGVGAHVIRRKVPEKANGPMCNVGPHVSMQVSGDVDNGNNYGTYKKASSKRSKVRPPAPVFMNDL